MHRRQRPVHGNDLASEEPSLAISCKADALALFRGSTRHFAQPSVPTEGRWSQDALFAGNGFVQRLIRSSMSRSVQQCPLCFAQNGGTKPPTSCCAGLQQRRVIWGVLDYDSRRCPPGTLERLRVPYATLPRTGPVLGCAVCAQTPGTAGVASKGPPRDLCSV